MKNLRIVFIFLVLFLVVGCDQTTIQTTNQDTTLVDTTTVVETTVNSTDNPTTLEVTTEEIVEYTVSFDLHIESTLQDILVSVDNPLTEIPDPFNTGHEFSGWYLDAEYTEEFDIAHYYNEDITLHAKWTVLKYDILISDWDGSIIDTISVRYGTLLSELNLPVLSRVGYTFTGWDHPLDVTMPDSNLGFEAQYEVNSYIITFFNYDNSYYDAIEVDYLTDISTIDIPIVEREGYTFVGWDVLPFKMPATNITATATFEINTYTANYYYNDVLHSTETVNHNELANLPTIQATDSNFVFDGWYLDSDKDTIYNEATFVTSDLDLYSYDLLVSEPVLYTEFNRLYGSAELNTYVSVKGIVTRIMMDYYLITSEYYSLLINSTTRLEYGDEVLICGIYKEFNNNNFIADLIVEDVISKDNEIVESKTVSTVYDLTLLSPEDQLTMGKLYTVTATLKEISGEYFLQDNQGYSIGILDYPTIDTLEYLDNYVGLEVTIDLFYLTKVEGEVYFGYNSDDYPLTVVSADSEWYAPMQDVNYLIDSMPIATWKNLNIPVTGPNGSSYTLSSSDHEVFNDAGGFMGIRSDTRTVTFTVTATNGSYSYTDTFDVIVPRILTFDEYFNSYDDYYYIIEGIVYVENELGAFIHDSNGNYIFIESSSIEHSVSIGDEIRVLGHKSVTGYYDLLVLSSHNSMPSTIDAEIIDFYDDTIKDGQIVNITCKIGVDSLNNVTLSNQIDKTIYVDDASNVFPLLGFDGEYVTMQVVKFNGRYVFYEGISDDVTIATPLTDLEKINLVLEYLDRYMAEINDVEYNINLPTSALGVDITWQSTNSDVISDTGVVTMIMGSDRLASLMATLTIGTETANEFYVVVVRDMYDMSPTSIHFALAANDGDSIKIKGFVAAIYEDRIYLQSGDDFLYINTFLGNDIVVGDLITIWGEMDTSNSSGYPKREMINASLYSVETTYFYDSDPVILSSPSSLGFTDQTEENYSKQYKIDLTIASMDDGTGLAHFNCFGATHIVFNPNDYINYFDRIYEVGDVITLEFIMHEFRDGHVFITNVVFPELSDGYITWLINDMTDIPSTITDDIDLSTYNEEYGVSLNWSSQKPDIISNEGFVTRPVNGTGDQIVYLALSFIYNGEYYTYSHQVTVLELPVE